MMCIDWLDYMIKRIVCNADGKVCNADGIVCDADGIVCNADGKVCNADNKKRKNVNNCKHAFFFMNLIAKLHLFKKFNLKKSFISMAFWLAWGLLNRGMNSEIRQIRQNVAIPVWENRVAPVFDTARDLLVLALRTGQIDAQEHKPFSADTYPEKVRTLTEWGVQTVVCGAISREFLSLLEASKIKVISFVAGEIEQITTAFIQGSLNEDRFAMPGCGGQPVNGSGRRVFRKRSCGMGYRNNWGAGNNVYDSLDKYPHDSARDGSDDSPHESPHESPHDGSDGWIQGSARGNSDGRNQESLRESVCERSDDRLHDSTRGNSARRRQGRRCKYAIEVPQQIPTESMLNDPILDESIVNPSEKESFK
jgi:predicted Fe-Mo cluster-binding NifX family protein